ncbi:MAG: hypothetical protein ACTHJS_05195 [Xanthobacteraceae bacterium]
MNPVIDDPFAVFGIAILVQWGAALTGDLLSPGMFSNFLLGYREHSGGQLTLIVLPVIASIAFFLIADIDSPYSGIISRPAKPAVDLRSDAAVKPHAEHRLPH